MSKKIVICASVSKEEKIIEWKKKLEDNNFEVIKYPSQIKEDNFLQGYKKEFKKHYKAIKDEADAILVANYDQKGIPGYVGAGTFAEMAFTLGLDKDIDVYYSNPIPKDKFSYSEELNYWKELGWIKKIEL